MPNHVRLDSGLAARVTVPPATARISSCSIESTNATESLTTAARGKSYTIVVGRAGKHPVSWFLDKSKYVRVVMSCSTVGTVPVNELLPRTR